MFNHSNSAIKDVKIMRVKLLEIVTNNLTKHRTEYTEAVTDYNKLVESIVNYNLEKFNQLKNNNDQSSVIDYSKELKAMPAAPTSFEKDYERAIRMLELSVEDEIQLSSESFNQLVLDEWSWKSTFIGTSTLYKTMLG